MKKARSNQDNKVRLVRDKLFINSCEYVPDSDEIEQTAAKGQSYHRKAKPQYVQNRSRNHQPPAFKSRVFQRSKYERYEQPNNKLNFQSSMASNMQSNPNSGMERSISGRIKPRHRLNPRQRRDIVIMRVLMPGIMTLAPLTPKYHLNRQRPIRVTVHIHRISSKHVYSKLQIWTAYNLITDH